MKVFKITYEDGKVKRLESEDQTFKVGRASNNNIVIRNDKVSREHGHFTVGGGMVTYFDRSKNGSLVNGEKVHNSGVHLKIGDVVELPGARIEYKGDDMRDKEAPPTVSLAAPIIAAVSFLVVLLGVAALIYFFGYAKRPQYDSLNCCKISNFQAGVITIDPMGNATVFESPTIPRIPDTKFGVYFQYESKSEKPIKYHQEMLYPYLPENWETWITDEGIFQLFPSENRGVFSTTLPAEKTSFTRVVTLDALYPVGTQTWKIYLDNELYKTVSFTVVAQELPPAPEEKKEEPEEEVKKPPVKKKTTPKVEEKEIPPITPEDGTGTTPDDGTGTTPPDGGGTTSPYGGGTTDDSQNRSLLRLLFPWMR
ncbi:MAG: FHA domain-containing protein [Deltaproteobacteria bacterium]|uniref:FHA domain-containing protein n=1 Tax=Candidatus Zymogenus saltonus TaxID=2844893 RepID=A0A9D8KF78_9DELT|nr:FHA domain-containing protein [Candidatus Zymogenus saltonus]